MNSCADSFKAILELGQYGDAFLKRMLDGLRLKDGTTLPQLLDQHHIAWTLLAAGTPAIAVLDRLPGWKRVYSDDSAVVHMRVDFH